MFRMVLVTAHAAHQRAFGPMKRSTTLSRRSPPLLRLAAMSRRTSPLLRLAATSMSSTQAGSSSLARFASRGPLHPMLSKLGSPVPESQWHTHSTLLMGQLGCAVDATDPANLPIDNPALAARILHLYLPIYYFVRDRVHAHRGAGALAVGLSAPQGCGKTTLVDLLVDLFAADGLTCAVVSIDDFYLTGAEQDALAAAHPANPLFQVRGNAGTHDVALGVSVLRALKAGGGAEPQLIPQYDKAARGGRGDRAPRSSWRAAPLADVVLLEGWMAGFEPLPPAQLRDDPSLQTLAGLAEVNERLAAYDAWHSLMDAWVVLASDPQHVYTWRLQAERAMAAAGRPGMSDAQVADFVSRYMPAYAAYLPQLYASAATRGVGSKPSLLVQVDATRGPTGGQLSSLNA